MPCYTTGSAEGDARLGEEEARKELARVTRVACELASVCQRLKHAFSKETTEWMADHARLDRARRLREEARREEAAVRSQALRKLTPKERRALMGY